MMSICAVCGMPFNEIEWHNCRPTPPALVWLSQACAEIQRLHDECVSAAWHYGDKPTADQSEALKSLKVAFTRALAALEAENKRMRGALERLGSSEAFDVARSIDKDRDRELVMRMDFARDAASTHPPQAQEKPK